MHIDIEKKVELAQYLKAKNWLADDENVVALAKPGEGNMNYTLRVTTNRRTLIVKQARAYVEKYPQIAAPANRAVVEGRFYEKIAESELLKSFMPELYGLDETENVLILEDLGAASDFTFLYQPNQKLSPNDAQTLAGFLADLHATFRRDQPDAAFANRQMRALNHEHIFKYPFMEENGFNLDQVTAGLQMVSMGYKIDAQLKATVAELGERYLADGNHLLHGDFYLGSFLKTKQGVKIIDPEFCFYGPAEFDLGVLTAHLMLAKQSEETIKTVYETYGRVENPRLVDQFTGVEIMRRLIGLAQLPLSIGLLDKEELLEQAYELIMKN